ncbi:MAG TPA: purine-nucleoside phosphorylase [Alphaproteobacteria bacterium]|nr:purine-nucleoside phosphorylase [Alphaproteobacteria bacterium]
MTAANLPRHAADAIRARAPDVNPRVAIVLGSGLGPLADRVKDAVAIPYADLQGFPEPGVSGHAGRLVLGRLGGIAVACLQGRAHAYEGRIDAMKVPVRTMKALGCEAIYLTCAAGSLRPEVDAGRLMTITDHLNLMGGNPLAGPNDEAWGPRFPPLAGAYDPDLRRFQAAAAADLGLDLADGVYAAWLGPSFETPAEVRMIKALGADAVGMSTVPECILARHCGLKVTATAVITNLGVGIADYPVDHAQTLRAAEAAGGDLQCLVIRFLERLGAG